MDTAIVPNFFTVESFMKILLDVISSNTDTPIEGFIPITGLQAQAMLEAVMRHIQLMQLQPLTSTPGNINAGSLYSFLNKDLKDDTILNTHVDLTAPCCPSAKEATPTWISYYEAFQALIAAGTTHITLADFKSRIDAINRNTFAAGACINRYLNSPSNSSLKATLKTLVEATPKKSSAKKSSANSGETSSSETKGNSWVAFQSVVKTNSDYKLLPIAPQYPTLESIKGSDILKKIWEPMPTDHKNRLTSATITTVGAFEDLTKELGYHTSWRNLLYACIKYYINDFLKAHQVPQVAQIPVAQQAPQVAQVFQFPTKPLPAIPAIPLKI